MRVRDQRDAEIKEYSGVDLKINDKVASVPGGGGGLGGAIPLPSKPYGR